MGNTGLQFLPSAWRSLIHGCHLVFKVYACTKKLTHRGDGTLRGTVRALLQDASFDASTLPWGPTGQFDKGWSAAETDASGDQ